MRPDARPVTWPFLLGMFSVGLLLQVLGRFLVGIQVAASPALARAVLNTYTSVVGIVTLLAAGMAFLMAVFQVLLVRRRRASLGQQVLMVVLPALLVSGLLALGAQAQVPAAASAIIVLACGVAAMVPVVVSGLLGERSTRSR